jgi:hypothetical protein
VLRPLQILYTYPEAADLLGLPSDKALRDLISRGNGPTHVKVGRRVSFLYSDLMTWAMAHRVSPRPSAVEHRPDPGVRRRGRPTVASRQLERDSQ